MYFYKSIKIFFSSDIPLQEAATTSATVNTLVSDVSVHGRQSGANSTPALRTAEASATALQPAVSSSNSIAQVSNVNSKYIFFYNLKVKSVASNV